MTDLLRSYSLLLALALFGCSTDTQEVADTIYSGGLILTIDDEQPIVEAVAVRDGRILAIADTDSVFAYQGESTEVFDLAGGTISTRARLSTSATSAASTRPASMARCR